MPKYQKKTSATFKATSVKSIGLNNTSKKLTQLEDNLKKLSN